jgi:O-antigen ligase
MLPILLVACGLIWFGLVLYFVIRRGFTVFLLWLLIAPIVLYVWHDSGVFSERRRVIEEEEPVVQTTKKPVVKKQHFIDALEGKGGSVRIREFIEPHRVMTTMFLLGILLHWIVRRKRLGRLDRTEICMGLFAGVLLTNVLLQANLFRFALRLATDAFLVHLFAYFVIRRLVTTEERFAKVIRIFCYVGVYLIGIVLIERMLHSNLLYRVEGPFGHRDRLYVVMVAVFFAVLAEQMSGRMLSWRKRLIPSPAGWFVVCLAPAVVVLTLTRANWVGFAFASWVCLAFAFRLIDFPRKLATASLLLLLVPILSAGWQALVPEQVVEDRLSQPKNVYARLAAWHATLQVFFENPILGIGLNDSRGFLELRAVTFEGVKNLRSVHNSYLAMVAELGILGLAAYLAVVLSLMHAGYALYRDGPELRDRWRGVAVVCMFMAYLITAVFSGLLYMPAVVHTYLFAYAGAVAGFYGNRGKAYLMNSAAHQERPLPIFSASARKMGWA